MTRRNHRHTAGMVAGTIAPYVSVENAQRVGRALGRGWSALKHHYQRGKITGPGGVKLQYRKPGRHATQQERKRLGSKKERSEQVSAERHGAIGKIFKHIHVYKAPKVKCEPGSATEKFDNNGVLTWTSNTQGVTMLQYLNTYDQILTSSGVTYSNKQQPNALMDFDPFEKTTNVIPPAAGVVAQPRMDKVFVKTIYYKITLTNFQTTASEFEIYLMKAKKPLNLNTMEPFQLWNNGYVDAALGQSVGVQRTVAVAGTTGYPTYSMITSKPGDSRILKQYWQILDVQPGTLSAGDATVRFTYALHVNKVFKRDDFIQAATLVGSGANTAVAGTLAFMLVARGCSAVFNTVSNQAAMAGGQIGLVAAVTEVIKFPMSNKSTGKIINTTQENYIGIITNEKQVNEVDTVVTVTKEQ